MKLFFYLLSFACILNSCSWTSSNQMSHPVAFVVQRAHECTRDIPDLWVCGQGGGITYGLENLTIGFIYEHEVQVEQARHFALYLMDRYLPAIHANPEMRARFREEGFSEKHMSIILIFRPKQGEKYLNAIHLSQGDVTYTEYDKTLKKRTDLFEESIEEAREKARQTPFKITDLPSFKKKILKAS